MQHQPHHERRTSLPGHHRDHAAPGVRGQSGQHTLPQTQTRKYQRVPRNMRRPHHAPKMSHTPIMQIQFYGKVRPMTRTHQTRSGEMGGKKKRVLGTRRPTTGENTQTAPNPRTYRRGMNPRHALRQKRAKKMVASALAVEGTGRDHVHNRPQPTGFHPGAFGVSRVFHKRETHFSLCRSKECLQLIVFSFFNFLKLFIISLFHKNHI